MKGRLASILNCQCAETNGAHRCAHPHSRRALLPRKSKQSHPCLLVQANVFAFVHSTYFVHSRRLPLASCTLKRNTRLSRFPFDVRYILTYKSIRRICICSRRSQYAIFERQRCSKLEQIHK